MSLVTYLKESLSVAAEIFQYSEYKRNGWTN